MIDPMLLVAMILVNYDLMAVVEILALMLVGMLNLIIVRMQDLMLKNLQYC